MPHHGGQNTALLAGWLYADLLLALAILGLGAATFSTVRASPPQQSNLDCRQFVYSFTMDEFRERPTFNRSFDDAVEAELERRRIPDAKPGILLFFGGYERNESVGVGQRRAETIRLSLRDSTPRLGQAEIRVLGARKVDTVEIGGRDKFALLIYFVFSGPDSLSGCPSTGSDRFPATE